jgi:hypothetical protein
LCRDRVAAAEHDVRAMIGVLRGPLPVTVRGVAMAGYLLTDGTGPLYDRHSPIALDAAVREATRQMVVPLAGSRAERDACFR